MNECGEMKTVMSIFDLYHFSTQNNRRDVQACTGLMTQEQYLQALYVLVSILSIVHKQKFDDIFTNEQFKLAELLKVAGIKSRVLTLMSNKALLEEYLEIKKKAEKKGLEALESQKKAEEKRLETEKKRLEALELQKKVKTWQLEAEEKQVEFRKKEAEKK